jgi:hypothetical protein
MSAFDVYLIYIAIKTHFTKKSYDYFRYGASAKASEEKFKQRNDVYFFEKLAKNLKNKQEVEQYFVSNFIVNSNFYIKEMSDKNYVDWKKKTQSISYLFESDLDKILMREPTLQDAMKCNSRVHSTLLKMHYGDQIMLETLVLLNRGVNFAERYDHILSGDPIWGRTSELIKRYSLFLQVDMEKIKKIITSKL